MRVQGYDTIFSRMIGDQLDANPSCISGMLPHLPEPDETMGLGTGSGVGQYRMYNSRSFSNSYIPRSVHFFYFFFLQYMFEPDSPSSVT